MLLQRVRQRPGTVRMRINDRVMLLQRVRQRLRTVRMRIEDKYAWTR